MNIVLPKGAQHIISRLNNAGYEAYIVGGCVRDSLMEKEPSDWDICTSARTDEMMKVFRDMRIVPTGLQHGTITILERDGAYEVTTFRIDGEYVDHRHPKSVLFTNELKEDLSRRDFTINAMAWHPEKGLIDLFNGIEDLNHRIIRAVGNPEKRFNEDGLRMLRMVRFATVLDFDYDQETYDAAVKLNYLMKHISKERVQVELNKILLAQHPARGLQDLYDIDLYPYICPYICHMVGFEQTSCYHFLDVFEHSLLAVGMTEQDLILRLTMFLHDVGKPFTWTVEADTGYDSFKNHAEVGAELANKILRDLKYDNVTRRSVVELINHHNDMICCDEITVRRLLSALGEEQARRLLKVKIADLMAHNFPFKRRQFVELFRNVDVVITEILKRGDCISISDLAINGNDVKQLGVSGRNIGEVLGAALNEVIINPEMNSYDKLMGWVVNLLKNQKNQ